MKDLEYPVRSVRLSDDVWEELKRQREASGLSWNRFLEALVDKNDEAA